jgi:hypothetical protein
MRLTIGSVYCVIIHLQLLFPLGYENTIMTLLKEEIKTFVEFSRNREYYDKYEEKRRNLKKYKQVKTSSSTRNLAI